MRRVAMLLALLTTVACASNQKACAQMSAGTFGSDWLVVQYDQAGRPFNCWEVRGAVVSSEDGGNVSWLDSGTGHLIHITGWENRVQVAKGDFNSAARLLGVDATKCGDGIYPKQQ